MAAKPFPICIATFLVDGICNGRQAEIHRQFFLNNSSAVLQPVKLR
jgi:hypothetical protein